MKRPGTILVIDDDEVAAFLTTTQLESTGFTGNIVSVNGAEQGLNFVEEFCHSKDRANCPLLILLDLNMPEMDGFDFLEALSERTDLCQNHISIAILTSSSNKEDYKRASEFNIAGYLNKPATASMLVPYLGAMETA